MRCVSPASLNCWLHSSLESCLCNCCMLVRLPSSRETRLTIATVNNGDMVVMQELSSKLEQANPDIQLRWVVLEENVWRQRTTTDVASGGWAIWCPDNRVLWNADLGETRLVKTIRSTRQVRRKWPNKTHQRRSFQQRQTLCCAVLWGKFHAVLPKRLVWKSSDYGSRTANLSPTPRMRE